MSLGYGPFCLLAAILCAVLLRSVYCLLENRFLQLEFGSLALEGVERIAEFPHEYEGTDKDEGA